VLVVTAIVIVAVVSLAIIFELGTDKTLSALGAALLGLALARYYLRR
jgi:hypothetical protein